MNQRIFPSIMGKSQREINQLFKKLERTANVLHLDVADGRFVPNTSLWFDFRLSSKFKYNAHLMIKDPLRWIEKKGHLVDLCIVHEETLADVPRFISFMQKKKKKIAFALKPETKVSPLLKDADYVLVLTVHPGFYGAKLLRSPLQKIKEIKKLNPRIKVIVDGHMNPNTIKLAKAAGADYFVSGSFVSQSENPKMALKELKEALK